MNTKRTLLVLLAIIRNLESHITSALNSRFRRSFWIVLTPRPLATSMETLTPNQAQENSMYLRRILSAVAMAVALLTMTLTEVRAQAPEPKLDGTFNAILTSGSFREKERYTFVSGHNADNGSVIFSNEVDAIPPCGTDQGVWARTGIRTYTLTHGAFCFDPSDETSYTLKWREVITLGPGGNKFTGRGFIEVFDSAKKLLFSSAYTLRGTRMQAEAPPAESAGSPTEQSSQQLFKWKGRR